MRVIWSGVEFEVLDTDENGMMTLKPVNMEDMKRFVVVTAEKPTRLSGTCQRNVELPTGARTYCMLSVGHEGECE